MKINFDQQVCSNFNLAANKEWLEVNKLGGYSASTIFGLNNRRYHGLFVVPCGPEQSRTIILSKFEESIFIGNQVYELSTNQFAGGIYPDGYKYIKNFSIDPFPKFEYEVENRRIEKSLFLCHDQHTLIIRYTCKNQGPPFNLVLKPILAARKISDLTHEIATFNADSYLENGVVKFTPLESLPELKIYYQSGEYIPAPLWYHNYVYEMDSRRKQRAGSAKTEDLFNPGFFTVRLEPYKSFELYVSIDKLIDFDYESICRREKEYRAQSDPGIANLEQTVSDISKRIESMTGKTDKVFPLKIYDYPKDDNTTGKTLLSLFGLAIHEGNQKPLEEAMLNLTARIENGLLPDTLDDMKTVGKSKYLYADLPLIFIYLIYALYDFRLGKKFIETNLLEPCLEIIEAYSKGTSGFIRMDKDGLLLTGDQNTVTSWLLGHTAGEQKIRCGKLCEINALWFNALKIVEFFYLKAGKKRQAKKIAVMSGPVKQAFHNLFWNSKQLQYADYIYNGEKDMTFAVSQLFLIGLPFSMLESDRSIFLLKQIEEYLLTSLGLRSLSPNNNFYKGRLSSVKSSDDPAFYNGAIWPWTIGGYVNAVLAIRGNNHKVIESLSGTLAMLAEFFSEKGLGTVSEFFEGNSPHRRNGQISSGLNLTEILRGYYSIHRAKKEREGFSDYV